MKTWKRQAPLSFALLFLLAAGCGGGAATRAKLSGQVTLDDVPLTKGAVKVTSEDGQITETASILSDGKYVIGKAPLGPVKLCLVIPPPPPTQFGAPLPPGKGFTPPPPKLGPEAEQREGMPSPEEIKEIERARSIHPGYQDFKASGLKTTVEKGDNEYNIKLLSKPPGWPTLKLPPEGMPR